MNEYLANSDSSLYTGILYIEIPNHISISQLIGKNGDFIDEIKNKFNAKSIVIINEKRPPLIKIVVNEGSYPDPIREYYNEYFEKYKFIEDSNNNVQIPDNFPIGHIIGKKRQHINYVCDKFNTEIIIRKCNTNNFIQIINNNNNLDEIKQYYIKFFRRNINNRNT